ncbi:MAG: tetratricopeptide repeat protein [Chloroflexota bacterium]
MQPEQTAGGLSTLIKSVAPLVGRVSAAVGGVLGLLAALKQVSGEVVTAIEGVLLVAAIVASAVVVWGRHTQTVEGNPVTLPLYPRRHRRIALGVLTVACVLTVLFVARIGADYLRGEDSGRQAGVGRLTPRPQQQVTRAVNPTVPPATTATATATGTPNVNLTTDVVALNRFGFEAIASKNYTQALGIFNRALQIQATNGRAQLGLGEAYYFLAQYAAAIQPLQNAPKLDPNLVEAHAYLGFVHEARQDFVRARIEYEEFIRVGVAPSYTELRSQVTDALKRISAVRGTLTPVPTR